MEKNQIYVKYGTNYTDMTIELLEQTDLDHLIRRKWQESRSEAIRRSVYPFVTGAPTSPQDLQIAIKPNLVSASPASQGGTTHPEIVAGILAYLRDHGYRKLTVMEGSWVGDKTDRAARAAGYDTLCEQAGIPFVDLQKDRAMTVDAAGMELHICRSIQDVDFLINVPVLKGHCQTRITCAMKNLKGLLPNSEKRRFHSMGLHAPIAHLNAVIRPDLIVVDNICGDLDFEDGGNPVEMNRILTGLDPVLMDAYVCHLLHYEIDQVPYIGMAEALGIGCADLAKADIRVCGQDPGTEFPSSRRVMEVEECVEEVDSCSACYGYLIPALDMLRQEVSLECFGDTKICIGQGWRGKTGELGIGTCTAKFRHHLEGCPPTETEMAAFLREYVTVSRN